MTIPESLEALLTTPGPPGQETRAAEAWRESARAFGDVSGDVLGSSWVRVPGTGGGPPLAHVGHIAENAPVVTHARGGGVVAVRPRWGFGPAGPPGQPVEGSTEGGPLGGGGGGPKPHRKP